MIAGADTPTPQTVGALRACPGWQPLSTGPLANSPHLVWPVLQTAAYPV
jgi:predicted dinucleotide-binding enzyme